LSIHSADQCTDAMQTPLLQGLQLSSRYEVLLNMPITTAATGSTCGCATPCAAMPRGEPPPAQSPQAGVDATPVASRAVAAVLGTAVLACVGCCVAPLLWPALSVGLAGSVLGALGAWQAQLAWLGGLVTLAGWAMLAWQARQAGRSMPTRSVRWLGLATLLTVVALAWVRLEPWLMAALGA
jgi:hypothetical protein